jgi:hypothetical protein
MGVGSVTRTVQVYTTKRVTHYSTTPVNHLTRSGVHHRMGVGPVIGTVQVCTLDSAQKGGGGGGRLQTF